MGLDIIIYHNKRRENPSHIQQRNEDASTRKLERFREPLERAQRDRDFSHHLCPTFRRKHLASDWTPCNDSECSGDPTGRISDHGKRHHLAGTLIPYTKLALAILVWRKAAALGKVNQFNDMAIYGSS